MTTDNLTQLDRIEEDIKFLHLNYIKINTDIIELKNELKKLNKNIEYFILNFQTETDDNCITTYDKFIQF